MKIRESRLQNGNFIYKLGIPVTKQESCTTNGILGLLFTLFQQIYEDISKNLVPIRPDRHYIRTNGRLAGKYSNTHKRAYWAKKYEYKEKGISMPIYKQKAGIIVL